MPLAKALVNGSFEEPKHSGPNKWKAFPDASHPDDPNHVPGWITSAPTGIIEICIAGLDGATPYEDGGVQYAELNATEVGTLYQDLETTPGAKMTWRLSHRGRMGPDTMALDIGPPDAPVEQQQFTDANTAWGRYEGEYVVPAGQTVTRFAFRSISATGGNPTAGNFLDAVSMAVEIPAEPEPCQGTSLGCAAEQALSGVGGAVNAMLCLVGDLAQSTAEATVPCEGSVEPPDRCATPVTVVVHYGSATVSNFATILSNVVRDATKSTNRAPCDEKTPVGAK